MKKISLDFDEVIYNLRELTHNFVYKHYSVLPETNNIGFGYYTDNFPLIYNCWGTEEEYSKGNLIQGAKEFVNELISIYSIDSIQIVTNSFDGVIDYKNNLIKELFGDIKVIHTKNKSLVTTGTILIDDALHNIEEHITNNINDYGIIFDLNYNWNQEKLEDKYNNIYRATSYDEVISLINIIIPKIK